MYYCSETIIFNYIIIKKPLLFNTDNIRFLNQNAIQIKL